MCKNRKGCAMNVFNCSGNWRFLYAHLSQFSWFSLVFHDWKSLVFIEKRFLKVSKMTEITYLYNFDEFFFFCDFEMLYKKLVKLQGELYSLARMKTNFDEFLLWISFINRHFWTFWRFLFVSFCFGDFGDFGFFQNVKFFIKVWKHHLALRRILTVLTHKRITNVSSKMRPASRS